MRVEGGAQHYIDDIPGFRTRTGETFASCSTLHIDGVSGFHLVLYVTPWVN